MIEIIPTVVPASWDDVLAAAARYSFASTLHVDFADGMFAPNTTWLPTERAPRGTPGIVLEAHLMVQEPKEMGMQLARAGFARLIGHVEAIGDPPATLEAWRESGAQEVGLGILMDTPLEAIDPFVQTIDALQMMTIGKIGVQGLPFDTKAPERVGAMHRRHRGLVISVDGSVNEITIVPLARAGATRFCVGSGLSKAPDPASTYAQLSGLAGGVE